MRIQSNRRARQSAQLQFRFSWPEGPANGCEKTKADGGANRYRPANDDDVFAEARGHIPPIGSPAYGRGSTDCAERIKG